MDADSENPRRWVLARRGVEALWALSVCAGLELATDASFTVLRDGQGPAGYHLLVWALSGAFLVGIALLSSVTRHAVVASLVVWVAVHGFDAPRFRHQILSVLVLALSTGIGLWFAGRDRRTPGLLGLVAGAALSLGWVGSKTVLDVHFATLDPGSPEAIGAPLLVYVGGLACFVLASRLPRVGANGLPISISVLVSWGLLAYFVAPRPTFETPHLPPESPRGPRPNLLVLMLDTVRADHLSLYGYALPTTPELESLRDRNPRARVYPFAFSTASWTLPAHASLFTGKIPSDHQMHFGNGGISGKSWGVDLGETLAMRLADAGYRTVGILANPVLTTAEGIDAGFERWVVARTPQLSRLPGERIRRRLFPDGYAKQGLLRPSALQVNRSVERELTGCPDGGCFVFANYMEAHEPYLPGPENAGRFRDPTMDRGQLALVLPASEQRIEFMSRVYDEAIRDLDADLGRLFAALETRGILDDLWLVILSDHGEAFYEHGAILHASNAYNEETRIPLMIVPPRGTSLPEVLDPVGMIDVAATLSAIGTGATLGQGRDLRNSPLEAQPVQIEFFSSRATGREIGPRGNLPARAVVSGRWKLIEIEGRFELYDLEVDPIESHDRAYAMPERVEAMRALLPPLVVHSDKVVRGKRELTPRTLESLRAIGYIE